MSSAPTLPERLRAMRAMLRFSQEQLAARLDVSVATVNRWEAGKSKPQRAQQAAIEKLLEEASGAADDEVRGTAPAGRRRRGVQKSAVLGNRGMEQMLWDAACSIRGQQDAPKFKEYILPLLFIKRLSDVFDDEVDRLAQMYGGRETALEILEEDHSLVRFYVPPEARWAVVSGRAAFEWPRGQTPKSLGEQLTTTIRAIVKENKTLAGVIDIVDYNETRNGEREITDSALKGIIETFSDPKYRLGLRDVEPDFLGRCYEYLLRKFAEGQGQSAGEFFTPTEVGFLMAEILQPRPGEEAYDYACGSFGLLIKLQLVSRRLNPTSKVPLKLYGQELTGSSYSIACMNRIIHDMDGEVVRGDSMRNPKFKGADGRLKKFDVVVANPMWNQAIDPDVYENDSFGRFLEYGGATSGKADWAWLQHTVACLKDCGRAAVVLDTGAVSRESSEKERSIRRWFVERDLIEGVISLPENLFYNTPAPGIIVVLRKQKPREKRGKIILVDASDKATKGTPKNFLSDSAIAEVVSAFLSGEATVGITAVMTPDDAANNDYNLLPSKYVRKDDGGAPLRAPNEVRSALKTADEDLRDRIAAVLVELEAAAFAPRDTEGWQQDTVGNCLTSVKGIHRVKILARDYLDSGRIPVVDQGQNFIAGWTNLDDASIASGLPYVVFGDHTRALKYVDFPFALGADGTQLLKPDARFDPLFFYFACVALRLPSRGYNRHFSLLKEQMIAYPRDVALQREIALALREVEVARNACDAQSALLREALAVLVARNIPRAPTV